MTRRYRFEFGRWFVGFLGLVIAVGCGDRASNTPSFPTGGDAPPGSVATAPADAGAPTTTVAPGPNDAPVKVTTPATLNEAIASADLRKLAVNDEISDVDLTLNVASYNIKKSTAAALDDVTARLRDLGFAAKPQTGEPQVSEEFAQASFSNGDFRLEVSITQQFDDHSASSVRILNMGNVDSRALPPLPDSKLLYGGIGTTIYVTPANVTDTIAAARNVLTAAGWQEYGPANATVSVDPDHRTLTFKQNAIDLTAFIGVAPAQNNQTTMQYGTSLLNHDLPAPPDALEIEFDDFRGFLRCKSGKSLAEVGNFYRQALGQRGWRTKTDTTVDGDSRLALVFENADQSLITLVEVRQSDDNTTLVQMHEVPAAALAEAEAEPPTELDMPQEPEPAQPPVTLAVTDLPIPEGAKVITENTDLGAFTYACSQSAEELLALTREKLSSLGWKENEALATINLPNASIGFDKDDASLMVVIGTAGANGGSILNFVVNDVEWTGTAGEEMPADEAPAAEDPEALTAEIQGGLPIPSDNDGYMSGGTKFRREVSSTSASSITTLLEFYRAELAKLKWKEDPDLAQIEDDRAALFFTTPDGTGSLKLTRANDATEIVLASRDAAAARKAGLLPKPNMARLIIGNLNDGPVTVTINKKAFQLKAGEGSEQPDGPAMDLPPGEYTMEAIVGGKAVQPSKITVGADEAWGVMVLEDVLPLQMY